MCLGLDTVPQRDGRTDGRTDRIGKRVSRDEKNETWSFRVNSTNFLGIFQHDHLRI